MTVATPTPAAVHHPLDAALHVQPQADGSWLARTPTGYWNMIGPYGGTTAALVVHSVLRQPDCLGEPVSLTVNYAAPLQDGPIRVMLQAVRTNRSTQHWQVQLLQASEGGSQVVTTTATVVTALRRETFCAEDGRPPYMPDPMTCERYHTQGAMEWLQRYDIRLVTGGVPKVWDGRAAEPITQLWVRDDPPRPLDFAALTALCDVFFPRIWLRRAQHVAAGTVSMTVYFHADAAQLAAQGSQHVLAQADAQAFRNGFFDQTAQLWDREGRLLATSHQLVYYKE